MISDMTANGHENPIEIIFRMIADPTGIRFILWTILASISFFMSGVDDFATIFSMVERLDVHGVNMFNYSILIAKFARFILSFYLNGVFWYTNFIDLIKIIYE